MVPEAFKKLSAVAEAVVKSPVVAKRLVPVAFVKVRFVEETLVEETETICINPEEETANFTDEATSKFKKSPL